MKEDLFIYLLSLLIALLALGIENYVRKIKKP